MNSDLVTSNEEFIYRKLFFSQSRVDLMIENKIYMYGFNAFYCKGRFFDRKSWIENLSDAYAWSIIYEIIKET